MPLNSTRLKLIGLLSLYLLLAGIYSVVVPIGRGADEWAHYRYARFIAEHGRLPFTPAEREAAGYKADQPPAYHLLAAGLTAWIETAGPPTFKYRAAAVRRRLVPAQGPEEILHTEDERFPWRQEILIWHLGRFLSIGFSLAALIVTYRVALAFFSAQARPLPVHALALAAAGTLAFMPRFLFTGMLLSYDSLLLLLASLFLWLSFRVVIDYPLRGGFWFLGGVAGLALMTKYLALLLPLVIVWLAVPPARGGATPSGSTRWGFLRRRRLGMTWEGLFSKGTLRRLGQAGLAFGLAVGWWFGYLILAFNEVAAYGPILGVLAPLIRGDGSDRTVERIFAWLSGGQAPPPAYIETKSYTVWRILAELPTTLWGNPIVRPYPLAWFVIAVTVLSLGAVVGLLVGRAWTRRENVLLLLYCGLPLPLMAVRLFGARDALEAVQGRHILFLAGPALVILLGRGWSYLLRGRRLRLFLYGWLGLLLSGAVAQLLFMAHTYPPLLPVRTTDYPMAGIEPPPVDISLPGGARLIGYRLDEQAGALRLALLWRGGAEPAPEDYLLELAALDQAGVVGSGWLAYQTQARYPTRAWEPGDTIRDETWLPLPPGRYEIRLRILGQAGPVVDWLPLTVYSRAGPVSGGSGWRQQGGRLVAGPVAVRERETLQFIGRTEALIDPAGERRLPALAGPGWANFIIAPHWPPGDYRLAEQRAAAVRVAPNGRNFEIPAEMSHPLEANFAGQIRLLGYRLPDRRTEPGGGLPITLYWQGLQWMGEDFVMFTRLLDAEQAAYGGYDRLAREDYSVLLWAPGEIITDGFAVPVEADAPDGIYTLSVGWYRRETGESLPLLDPATGQPTGAAAVLIGPIKVGGPPPGATLSRVDPRRPVETTLDDTIRLIGFDARSGAACWPAAPLELVLYWEALERPALDYTVFVHVRNEAGETVAQRDAPPDYPTGLWEAGEIIRQPLTMPLDQLEPGRYRLVAGLYDFATGLRLGTPDDEILLHTFEICGER